jgi:hypothetical protein
MLLKTATSLAFATACLTALATAPGAQAQSANAPGAYAPTYQNQMPQTPPNGPSNWSQGGSGSTSGNYAPQPYQGNASSAAGMSSGDQLVTNGPQSSGVEQSGGWSAQQNVVESHRYDRLVEANRGFRHARMVKECSPVTDPQLHDQCVASFNEDEPAMSGSSTGPHKYHSNSGS